MGVGAKSTGTSSVGVKGEGTYGVHGIGTEIGVYGYVEYDGTGVLGESPDGSNTVGVSGYAGTYNSVGIYGYAAGHFALAGLFDGDVVVNGACDPCSPSDIKFKKNIKPVSGGLAKVMALKPSTYEMKTEEYKGKLNLASGTQYGFIAQEVEAVIPDLVRDISVPATMTAEERRNKVRKEPVQFKALDYKDLIPVLVAAIQELQAEVEALKAGR